MAQQVLILGGTGLIGSSIAADLLACTTARFTIAGRNQKVGIKLSQQLGDRCRFAAIDLD